MRKVVFAITGGCIVMDKLSMFVHMGFDKTFARRGSGKCGVWPLGGDHDGSRL